MENLIYVCSLNEYENINENVSIDDIDGNNDIDINDIDELQEAYSLLENINVNLYNNTYSFIETSVLLEAKYQGRDVKLGKIMQGDVKKFKVFVKNNNDKVVKVNFGQKGVRIKKDNPIRRKSFRARHKCSMPGPIWKPKYWACKTW